MLDITTIQPSAIDLLSAVKVKHGQFSHCFFFSHGQYVVLNSIDVVKECFAAWLNFNDNPHLPEIHRIDYNWYVMPQYKNLTAKSKKAYKQFAQLDFLLSTHSAEIYGPYYRPLHNNYNECIQFAELVKTEVDEKVGEALEILIMQASNATGLICLDFKKENFSVRDTGELILRDVIADTYAMRSGTKISRRTPTEIA